MHGLPLAVGRICARRLDRWTSRDWKSPLTFALLLHLVTLTLVLTAPYVGWQPEPVEVQTVNLFAAPEPERSAPPSPPAAVKQPPTPEVSPSPQAISTAPAPPAPAVPHKVVSLHPLKRKKRHHPKQQQQKADATRLQRALQQVKSRIAQKEADAEAQRQVSAALAKLRSTLLATGEASPPSPADSGAGRPAPAADSVASTGSSGNQELASLAKKRYYADLIMHLSRFWKLPETQNWDEQLLAIVALWIAPNGDIIKSAFEQKSANDYFNRFVRQTLEKASPFPAVPPELRQEFQENGIGLRFKPGELY